MRRQPIESLTQHPRQGLELMRRLQKQAGPSLERKVVHTLGVAGGLKGFKHRSDLARFLETTSGQLGRGG